MNNLRYFLILLIILTTLFPGIDLRHASGQRADFCLLLTESPLEQKGQTVFWWAPQGKGRSPFSEYLAASLREKGFLVVFDSPPESISVHAIFHHSDLNAQEAVNLANLLNAKFVIFGSAKAELIGKIDPPTLVAVRMELSLEMWNAKNNQKLGAMAISGTGFHKNPEEAMTDAVRDISSGVSHFLQPALTVSESLSPTARHGNVIRLFVQGFIDHRQFQTFTKEMTEKNPHFPMVLSELMPGTFMFRVMVPLGQTVQSVRENLRANLLTIPFEKFSLTVQDLDESSLQILFIPKTPPEQQE